MKNNIDQEILKILYFRKIYVKLEELVDKLNETEDNVVNSINKINRKIEKKGYQIYNAYNGYILMKIEEKNSPKQEILANETEKKIAYIICLYILDENQSITSLAMDNYITVGTVNDYLMTKYNLKTFELRTIEFKTKIDIFLKLYLMIIESKATNNFIELLRDNLQISSEFFKKAQTLAKLCIERFKKNNVAEKMQIRSFDYQKLELLIVYYFLHYKSMKLTYYSEYKVFLPSELELEYLFKLIFNYNSKK